MWVYIDYFNYKQFKRQSYLILIRIQCVTWFKRNFKKNLQLSCNMCHDNEDFFV